MRVSTLQLMECVKSEPGSAAFSATASNSTVASEGSARRCRSRGVVRPVPARGSRADEEEAAGDAGEKHRHVLAAERARLRFDVLLPEDLPGDLDEELRHLPDRSRWPGSRAGNRARLDARASAYRATTRAIFSGSARPASSVNERAVPVSLTKDGMMLNAVPPWTLPTVTTAESSGEISRETMD